MALNLEERTIYFMGSIRRSGEFQPAYKIFTNYLNKTYGEVLTQHIGDPALTAYGEFRANDKEIYDRNTASLMRAKVAIGDLSSSSLGISHELKCIEEQKKAHLFLYYNTQERVRLSPLITCNPFFNIEYYDSIEHAITHIDKFFAELKWTKLNSK